MPMITHAVDLIFLICLRSAPMCLHSEFVPTNFSLANDINELIAVKGKITPQQQDFI